MTLAAELACNVLRRWPAMSVRLSGRGSWSCPCGLPMMAALTSAAEMARLPRLPRSPIAMVMMLMTMRRMRMRMMLVMVMAMVMMLMMMMVNCLPGSQDLPEMV